MTKRWIYALMVAAIIMVGAIAGPVMAAAQGTAVAPAPAAVNQETAAGPAANAGTTSIAGTSSIAAVISTSYTVPRFHWYVSTVSTETSGVVVYTVPSGYKLQIDDIVISNFASTAPAYNYLYRGVGGNTLSSGVALPGLGHFEQGYQNLVLNGGETLRVKSIGGTTQGIAWTITAHWV